MRINRFIPAALAILIAIMVLSALPPLPQKGGQFSPAVSDHGNVLVSSGMGGMNAEVEQVYNPENGYIYEAWIANFSIGFAYSTNGGASFAGQMVLPGSHVVPGTRIYSWDPSIALFQNGSIVVAFMHEFSNGSISPVVDFSFNNGTSFPITSVVNPVSNASFSDRDFVAVAPNGTVYVTWNHAPNGSLVSYYCPPGASCYYTFGDFNGMISYSSNLGKSWSVPKAFSPYYPNGGMVSAPLVIAPNGTIMILYEDYNMSSSHALGKGYNYFTESTNGGSSWSKRVLVGNGSGYLPGTDWWIDGAIALGRNGTIYATFDLMSNGVDIPYLSYSRDNGRTWTTIPVHSSSTPYEHIIQPSPGPNGTVMLAWVTNSSLPGLSAYARVFSSVTGNFLTPVERVSSNYGSSKVWGGDTIGISTLGDNTIGVSWGQANSSNSPSEIYFSSMTFYNVTIHEKGLPAGSTWDVNVQGSPFSSNSANVSILLPSGNYSAIASFPGYSPSPSPADFRVSGTSAFVNLTFTKNPVPTPHTTPPAIPFILLIEVTVVVLSAAILVAIVIWKRKQA